MKSLAFATILLLAGCATKPEPEIITQPVNVMVPVPCKVDLEADPVYPDSDAELANVPYPGASALLAANPLNPAALNQMGADLLYLVAHYRAGRDMRAARDAQKQAALDKCGEGTRP